MNAFNLQVRLFSPIMRRRLIVEPRPSARIGLTIICHMQKLRRNAKYVLKNMRLNNVFVMYENRKTPVYILLENVLIAINRMFRNLMCARFL